MKKGSVIVIALSSILFIRCKKEYTCECGNPGGIFKTFTINDTKENAQKKCVENIPNVSFSETYCNLK